MDEDAYNQSLARLESILVFAGYNIGEARIVLALMVYERLSAKDLIDVTGMKQSAVSRALDNLGYHGHLSIGVGKDKGRPYQVYSLKDSPSEVVMTMKRVLDERVDDLKVLMGSLGME